MPAPCRRRGGEILGPSPGSRRDGPGNRRAARRTGLPVGNLSASVRAVGGHHGGQAGRHRGFGDHGLGHRRGRGQGRLSRSCCAAARRSTADAMVAGLEKSLAKQVERGKLEAGRPRRGARPRARRRRPRRARRLRPRDRVDRRGPRREEAPLHRARPHLRRRTRSSPPTRRRCPSSRWRWRPAAPTRSAASTSSTPRR